MQIGETLWCHDYRSHRKPWFDAVITAETKQSWILGEGARYKVNKKTMLENQGVYGNRQWHTPASKAVKLWLDEHPRKIAEKLAHCRDVDTLLKVASIIGYEAISPAVTNGGRQ